MWVFSSRLFQQSGATAPYLGRGISPHCHHSSLDRGVAPLVPPVPMQAQLQDVWYQSWLFTRRTDAEAATTALCPPMQRTVSVEKILKLGRTEGQGEGDERALDGWMALGIRWTWVSASSGSWWWTGNLVCCSPWGCTQSDTTEQMKGTDCNGENALNTSSYRVSKWKRKRFFINMEYKEGAQHLHVCV